MADQERSGYIEPNDTQKGVHRDRDGRIQPDDSGERVSPIDRDTAEEDGTVRGHTAGAVVGAGLGAVVGGPIGAIAGAVLGAGAGKVAEEANREDPNSAVGNPTDSDRHRVKNDYFAGQIYEEGSLADVRVKQARDIKGDVDSDTAKADRG